MVNDSKNIDENYSNILETLKNFFSTNWTILLIGFVFSITRIHYLTYPLGLLHRQIIKEGFRSYEAVTVLLNSALKDTLSYRYLFFY